MLAGHWPSCASAGHARLPTLQGGLMVLAASLGSGPTSTMGTVTSSPSAKQPHTHPLAELAEAQRARHSV